MTELEAKQNELISNPKYDAEWVAVAAALIINPDFSISDPVELEPYIASQLNQIKVAVESEGKVPYGILLHPEYNSTHMQLIITGITNGLSIDKVLEVVTPETPYAIANYVLQALIEGKEEIIKYSRNKKFNVDQIFEIYAGLMEGVDVSEYADPEINAKFMGLYRHALNLGIKIEIKE